MTAKMSHKTCRLAVALTVATVLTPALPVIAVVTYDTRALSGDPAPGTNRVYSSFAAPMIDGAGQVAFRAITSATDRGFWSEDSGSLNLVALDGTTAPGTTGVYTFLDKLVLNSAGKTAFFAPLLKGTGGVTFKNNGGIWSDHLGSLSLVVRRGDAAPGTPGGVFEALSPPVFNDAGETAFLGALLVGTGDVIWENRNAIWAGGSGSLNLIVREGFAAPGTAAGVVFGDNVEGGLFSKPVLNGAGQTAFWGRLFNDTEGVVIPENDEGIWSEGSGSLSLVAREGSAAPGTAGGVYGNLGSNLGFNHAGQIAFSGSLLVGSGDVTSANDFGIWSGDTGSLSLVARKGDAAPGTAAGVVYNGFDNPNLNGAGQTAFHGGLTGPGVTSDNNEGIWSEGSGSLSLIAREGDAAPGTDGVFRSFSLLANNLILNGAGQVAFTGILLAGTGGVTLANDRGIWATDTDGQLTLIVREGDLFDVNDDPLIDDFRTIKSLALVTTQAGGEDGRGTPFNDAGQIAFQLKFTNDSSSGIFVASIQPLAGDLDGDGFVGVKDLNIILGTWNQTVPGGDLDQTILSGDPLAGDINGDGFVGINDLNVVLSNWNAGTPPVDSAAIPEPTSLALLGLGGLALASRWRSSRTG